MSSVNFRESTNSLRGIVGDGVAFIIQCTSPHEVKDPMSTPSCIDVCIILTMRGRTGKDVSTAAVRAAVSAAAVQARIATRRARLAATAVAARCSSNVCQGALLNEMCGDL